MELTTAYSLWYIIPSLLAAFGYAFLLYHRSRDSRELPPWMKRLLFGLRFTLVFLLFFLLLRPVMEWFANDIRKPILLFVQDNSASLTTGCDSTFLYESWPSMTRDFLSSFGSEYVTKAVSFDASVSDSLKCSYDGEKTNFSHLLEDIRTRYDNRNLGAVILASDGRYNSGKDPVPDAIKLETPVYTIAMGDTVVHKDILIKEALHNHLAYQGNTFPVRITIGAAMCGGDATELIIRHHGRALYTKRITIKGDHDFLEQTVQLPADSAGIQQYDIVVKPVEDEITGENNRKSIFVKVIDSRQKILLLTASPHPDVAAIRRAISSRISYRIEVATLRLFDKPLKEYNMIIWYQIPGKDGRATKLLEKAEEYDIPQLFVLGNSSDLESFNKLGTGLEIVGRRVTPPNEVVPVFNESFNLFSLDESDRGVPGKVPPLYAPFGRYRLATGAQVLCYQKIGALVTDQPLIYLMNNGQYRLGVICGEGLWRWRLYEYKASNSQSHFDGLIRHMVQYLASKGSAERLFIDAKESYTNSNPLIFHANVYDKAFEPIRDAEIKMIISDSSRHKFPYQFFNVHGTYSLDAGRFQPGIYNFTASCKNGKELLSSSGSFAVIRQDIEKRETVADHQLLYRLSSATGGAMQYPGQLKHLSELIRNRADISSFNHTTKKMLSIIHFKWLFWLLVVFLAMEWFIRKRHGAF